MPKINDDGIIDQYIIKAEDELTSIAKQDFRNARRITINSAHSANHQTKPKPELIQQGKNVGYALDTTVRRLVQKFTRNNQQVRFAHKPTVARFHKKEQTIMITYDSGADNHYMSESDRIRLGLPILRPSHKRVAVVNGGTSSGKVFTRLPFPKLPSLEVSPTLISDEGNSSNVSDSAVTVDNFGKGNRVKTYCCLCHH